MKRIGFLILMSVQVCYAQTKFNRTIEISNGQSVSMEFPFADLVNIRGYDGSSIQVTGDISINVGKNNDAYQILMEDENGLRSIRGDIKDYDNLPEMITIKKGDQVYYFDTDDWNSPAIQKFYEEEGREGLNWVSHGVAREIKLEIMVPRSIGSLDVTSKFGLIDIEGLDIPIKASSKHGGVDLAVPSTKKYKFTLDSQWGIIYTNLDLELSAMKGFGESNDWNHVECSINGGGGPAMELISQHGNIYLRQQ